MSAPVVAHWTAVHAEQVSNLLCPTARAKGHIELRFLYGLLTQDRIAPVAPAVDSLNHLLPFLIGEDPQRSHVAGGVGGFRFVSGPIVGADHRLVSPFRGLDTERISQSERKPTPAPRHFTTNASARMRAGNFMARSGITVVWTNGCPSTDRTLDTKWSRLLAWWL